MAPHGSYCCVDSCNNHSVINRQFSFFRFPKDPVRCQQWKDVLGFVEEHKYANVTPKEAFNIRICSIHFDENSITLSGKRLLSTAVPTKLLLRHEETSEIERIDAEEDPNNVFSPSSSDRVNNSPVGIVNEPSPSSTSPENQQEDLRIEKMTDSIKQQKELHGIRMKIEMEQLLTAYAERKKAEAEADLAVLKLDLFKKSQLD